MGPTSIDVRVFSPTDVERSLAAAPPNVVTVVPFVAEVPWLSPAEDAAGERLTGEDAASLIAKVHTVLSGKVHVELWSRHASEKDFWSGHAERFLSKVLPHLPNHSFIVSHGLFMQFRLCRGRPCVDEWVPNGGMLVVERAGKRVYVVRHCPTCANINNAHKEVVGGRPNGTDATDHRKQRDSLALLKKSATTMCADVSALQHPRAFFRSLRARGLRPMLFCSPLPRAMVTAASLALDITATQLRDLQKVFRVCEDTPRARLRSYLQTHTCVGTTAVAQHSLYCNADGR